MLKDPNEDRLQARLPLERKIDFINLAEELGMKHSELIVYLINNSLLLEVDNLKFFRKTLRKRVRAGINTEFLQELLKLKNDINIYTRLL